MAAPARAAAAALAALASCGYVFTSGQSRLPPGAGRVAVRPLEVRSAEAEVGAWVAAALRAELARRNADGGEGAPARIEGEVEEVSASPAAAGGGVWRLVLAVRVRLLADGRVLGEARSRRTDEYLVGVDPLESEGRRRTALARACAAAAREIVERLETVP